MPFLTRDISALATVRFSSALSSETLKPWSSTRWSSDTDRFLRYTSTTRLYAVRNKKGFQSLMTPPPCRKSHARVNVSCVRSRATSRSAIFIVRNLKSEAECRSYAARNSFSSSCCSDVSPIAFLPYHKLEFSRIFGMKCKVSALGASWKGGGSGAQSPGFINYYLIKKHHEHHYQDIGRKLDGGCRRLCARILTAH